MKEEIKGGKIFKIAVLAGDGIGAEIMPQAVKALKMVSEIYGCKFEFREALYFLEVQLYFFR